jgi:DNA-binding PadR family transcriptional regulator
MARRKDEVAWSDPALLILGSLASGPKHGYAIVQDIEASAGISMGPGTLYGALPRLEQRGLVRPLPGDDRRRPYELTAEGARILRVRLEAMQTFAKRGLSLLTPVTP